MDKGGFVYILTNRRQGALYTGVTSDLMKRISQHRLGLTPGFATRYYITRLVWYEAHDAIGSAIAREKQIKTWNRAWKIALFAENNPDWHDLAVSHLGFEALTARQPGKSAGPSAAVSGDGPPLSRG